MIKEKAYAKINITLKVLGKREDGYHNLESIMAPITLCDELTFKKSNELMIKSNLFIKDNSIMKAMELLKSLYNVKEGAFINVTKKIPLSAGLAGGSADASATLRGLNKLWKLNLALSRLEEISLMLGSDNAFCMYNKIAKVEGRGEKITPCDYPLPKYVLLVNPKFMVSTKEIFNAYQEPLEETSNDLEPTTMKLYPKLKEIKDELQEELFFQMSGSGPTLFALSDDYKVLKSLYNQKKLKYTVFIAKILRK